jgi:hypothetical protein
MNNPIKLLALFVTLAYCTSYTTAQEMDISKAWIAGGSLSFAVQQNAQPFTLLPFIGQIRIVSNDDDARSTNFSFSPYIGKELNANWILGLQLQYTMNRYSSEDVIDFLGQQDTFDVKQKENAYTIGLFGRYMFNPESKFVFFLQPSASYSFVDEVQWRDDVITDELESYAISVGASGGVLYNISDRWRLTSRIGLLNFVTGKWTDNESDESNTFSSFGATFSLSSLNLGFEYRF